MKLGFYFLLSVLRHLFKSFNLDDVEALYTDDYPTQDCG
jgi:hypothetical protein